MTPLYDFTCPRGHSFEALAARGVEEAACQCGKQARRALSRFAFATAHPAGVPIRDYHEAASEAQYAHDRTDDPSAKAATRPDIWRPALVRSRNKLHEAALGVADEQRWADPRPKLSERQVREEVG